MTNNMLISRKGFTWTEILPALIIIQLIVIFIILVFMIIFNYSVYAQWVKFSDLQEANISLNNIASDIDSCSSPGTDCNSCNQKMMDKNNPPFLMDTYQSPNFRFDIDSSIPGSASCVIHAVKVDGYKNPLYNLTNYPPVSFDCGGHHIVVRDNTSGFDLCRELSGSRTIHGFGMYRTLSL